MNSHLILHNILNINGSHCKQTRSKTSFPLGCVDVVVSTKIKTNLAQLMTIQYENTFSYEFSDAGNMKLKRREKILRIDKSGSNFWPKNIINQLLIGET